MGAFIVNFQLRCDSQKDAVREARKLLKTSGYISKPRSGWITIYDKEADEQDDAVLHRVARGLSRSLGTACFAFLVHDSDILMYLLYERGQIVDQYNSAPDYFEEVDDAERDRWRGNPDELLKYCLPGTTRQTVESTLAGDGWGTMADDGLRALGNLLGIDENRILLGFKYFAEEGSELLEDASDFTYVGPGKRTPVRRKKRTAAASSDDSADSEAVRAMTKWVQYCATIMMLANWEKVSRLMQVAIRLQGRRSDDGDGRKAYLAQFRKTLRAVQILNAPSADELIAAADQGPPALAALIAARTPEALTEIGSMVAIQGTAAFMRALVENGLSVNSAPVFGRTLLMLASTRGDAPMVQALLELGADVHTRDEGGGFALLYAAQSGSAPVVQRILEAGGDVAAKNSQGTTALGAARQMAQHRPACREIVDLLLAAGAIE